MDAWEPAPSDINIVKGNSYLQEIIQLIQKKRKLRRMGQLLDIQELKGILI